MKKMFKKENLDELLWKAVENQNIEETKKYLVQGADPNVDNHVSITRLRVDLGDTTPVLILACALENMDIVKILLQHGANIENPCINELTYPFTDEQTYFCGSTALTVSSQVGSLDLVKFLIQKGAEANCRSQWVKATPIMAASNEGHLEIVKYLISVKVELNYTDADIHTALYYAATNGHAKIVQELLKNGARFTDETEQKKALKDVRKNGHDRLVEIIKSIEKEKFF